MAILAQECIGWIESTLGGTSQEAAKQTLNYAGEMLVQLHEWRWLEREATLNVTAGQDYTTLPTDFRAMLETDEDGSYSGFVRAPIETLVLLKSSGFDGNVAYTGTVTYRVIANVPTPVLRLDPTPTTTATDEFNIAYLAGWTELDDDNDTVVIVPWLKALYRELVVAYARGYDEEDETRAAPAGQLIEEHLTVIKQGITYRMAVNRDAQINPGYGNIRNGWLEAGKRSFDQNYLTTIPGNPV